MLNKARMTILAIPHSLDRSAAPDSEVLDGLQKPKHIQEPHNDHDNHHSIQNRFNRICHWYERIHEPEKNANDDKGKNHLK